MMNGSLYVKISNETARKTKCDGQHPTCQSCARRNLPCSYVNESSGRGKRGHAAAAAQAAQQAALEYQQKSGKPLSSASQGASVNGSGDGDADGEAEGDDSRSGSEEAPTRRRGRGGSAKRGIDVEADVETSSNASKRMRVSSMGLDELEKPRVGLVAQA